MQGCERGNQPQVGHVENTMLRQGSSWGCTGAPAVNAGVRLGGVCLLSAKEVALEAMSGQARHTDDRYLKFWTLEAGVVSVHIFSDAQGIQPNAAGF